MKIGEECEIYKDVVFGSEPYLIEIGDHVRITNGCKFITHDGGVWVIRQLMDDNEIDLFGKIIVGNNVHIGMNCIIMPNVKLEIMLLLDVELLSLRIYLMEKFGEEYQQNLLNK
ncbi:MAG: hypothetical protein ACLSBH_11080 [Coprobacillus cateniformis]